MIIMVGCLLLYHHDTTASQCQTRLAVRSFHLDEQILRVFYAHRADLKHGEASLHDCVQHNHNTNEGTESITRHRDKHRCMYCRKVRSTAQVIGVVKLEKGPQPKKLNAREPSLAMQRLAFHYIAPSGSCGGATLCFVLSRALSKDSVEHVYHLRLTRFAP